MIEVKNLTKRYGSNVAIDHVSFSVDEGTIVGFLGPNGAGKSTTMNIITGYLSASEGSVTVSGHSILDEPSEVKKLIGYLPEMPPLYMDMTVKEYLNFMYDLKKVTIPREKHIQEICSLVKIKDVYNRLIANLSKGYKQRVGLAQAILGDPRVLILDEPTVGLDPKQIIEIRNLIKSLSKKHTIILSSHVLSEVSAVCDRVVIINKGKLVASDTPENLSKQLQGMNRLQIRVAAPEKTALRLVGEIPGIAKMYSQGEHEPGTTDLVVETENNIDARKTVFNGMARANCPLLMMRPLYLSLEEIFLKVTHLDKEV